MSIQAYGAAMARLGEARQRAFDKADANKGGALGLDEFKVAMQTRQGGTNGSADPAAGTVSDGQVAALFNKLDVSGTGQLTMQELNQAARPHGGHHGQHGRGGGLGGLLGGDALGTLLGGQESAGEATPEAGQSGPLASIQGAVERAVGSYLGRRHSATAA